MDSIQGVKTVTQKARAKQMLVKQIYLDTTRSELRKLGFDQRGENSDPKGPGETDARKTNTPRYYMIRADEVWIRFEG